MTDVAQGLQLTALDPDYRADPYPRLRQAREDCPVRRDQFFGAVQLTRYADVRGVLTDRTLWRDPMRADDSSLARRRRALAEGENRDGPRSILTSDDPGSWPGARSDDAGAVQAFQRVARHGRRGGRAPPRRPEVGQDSFDLIATYAMPIPIEVIAHMLGVDEGRLAEFRSWSEAIIQTFNPARTPEQTEADDDRLPVGGGVHRRVDGHAPRRAARRPGQRSW